jgi:hypothetical protein
MPTACTAAQILNSFGTNRKLVMRRFLRRRPLQALAASVLAMAVGLGVAGPAHAAATRAQKMPLTKTNADCPGYTSPAARAKAFGFAVIIAPAPGKLVVQVVLKGAPANTTFNIRMIQVLPDASDCGSATVFDGTLTTDATGNGNANIQEAVLPRAHTVWVDLNNQADFSDFFTTQVVSF